MKPTETIRSFTMPKHEAIAQLRKTQKDHAAAINEFHRTFYKAPSTWAATTYRGVHVMKTPSDLWTYQHEIAKIRPELIIETGTADGGSAFYFADLCALLNCGRVVTIDSVAREGRPSHPFIEYLKGDSVSKHIKRAVESIVKTITGPIMVSLDSGHEPPQVAAELKFYPQFVTRGSMLVVEDTHLGGHPVEPRFPGGGPMAALNPWLKRTQAFEADPLCEGYLFSFHTWLRRVR